MSSYEALVGEASRLQRSGDGPGAVEKLREAIALDESRPEAWQDLGLLLDALGRPEAARKALRSSVERAPDRYEGWSILAFVTGRDDPTEGAAVYREVLQRWPEDFAAWHNLGCLLRSTGALDEALAALQRAERLKDDSPALAYNLGQTHEALGDLDEARACYARSVALFGGFEPGLAALLRLGARG